MLHYLEFRAMGCRVVVQLEAENDALALLQAIPAKIEALEAQLSRFRPTSDLNRCNARAGDWIAVSAALFENIRIVKHMARLTDGLYNPLILPALIASGYDRSFEQMQHPVADSAIPAADWHDILLREKTHEIQIPAHSALDLGGIAKGWTAATIADELAPHGACLVNLGGDMAARGAPEGLPGWAIAIEDPFTGASFITVWLTNTSIATSGTDYRRWQTSDGQSRHHLIDPRTGASAATDVVTATVIHPHAPTAEAYTKAVLLRGAANGLNWLNQQWHSAGLVFQQDSAALATTTFTHFTHERNLQP